jgi:hypothetical protein
MRAVAFRLGRWPRALAFSAVAFHFGSTAIAQTDAPASPPSAADEADAAAGQDGLGRKRECIAQHAGAQRSRAAQRLREAREQALACSRAECPEVLRAECGVWLGEITREQPTVILAARDGSGRALTTVSVREGTSVLVARLDGRDIELDPGLHTLTFEGGGVARGLQVLVRPNEKHQLVEVMLAQPPTLDRPTGPPHPRTRDTGDASRGLPTASWILGGIAAGGFLSATYFGLSGLGQQRDLEQTCAPRCPTGDVDRMQNAYLAADISLGVALAATAGAVWFALSQGDRRPAETASRSRAAGPRAARR